MRKTILFLLIAILFASCTDVNPGYVDVRVHKRGSRAGEIEVLTTGRYGIKLSADDFIFPTFKQNYVWTASRTEGSKNDESFTFPVEGLNVGVDIGVEFAVNPEKVETIFSEYRKDLAGITSGPMRNYIRDAVLRNAKKYTNAENFVSTNGAVDLIEDVEKDTMEYFKPKGIDVSKVYIVGAPRYPSDIVQAIKNKINANLQAIQRENELRESEAEAKKAIAKAQGVADAKLIEARAEAEANRLKQTSYNDAILKAMWIDKWDGKLPTYQAGSDGSVMFSFQ
ncbi:SPFH domain-containing protein [Spirochaeta cellobiosiphila]|uniref:SPFH domain-containing protein n=1 Tax=Spirochaeta cellobiosiphila TaxID=504483 RepID=UPI0004262FD5|nr:SPFH domain-containing protein [Spirochaeta cellobiosiphila]